MAAGNTEPMGEIDCQRALYELYYYLDGELTVERRSTIQVHLQGCSHCLEAFDFEAELKMVISARARETVPADLMRRIRSALGLEF